MSQDTANLFLPRECEIVHVEAFTPSEKRFTLRLRDGRAMDHLPGQFMELSLFGFGEIPIGFASSPTRKDSFDVVVRKVGRVSTAIFNLERGNSVFMRGPYGRGFDLESIQDQNVLIVAGGIGLAPTRSLIQYILDRRKEFGRFTLFYGAKTPKDQLFSQDLDLWRRSKDVEFFETVDRTEPGWGGNVGLITSLFKKTKLDPDTRVVVCGPPIMYKFVLRELVGGGIRYENIFLDLERRMKCGVGKCGHCQINDQYVCVDGPVFTYQKLREMEEAFG